jgi:predicted O-linked N-acetylglucosamine transferase (SPINDLY family)
MGVPVITYTGESHAGRVGSSILTALGLDEFIASSDDDYIGIAKGLAGNNARLTELRRGLRSRMAESSLSDGRAFAHKMEQAYRTIWQEYCSSVRNV